MAAASTPPARRGQGKPGTPRILRKRGDLGLVGLKGIYRGLGIYNRVPFLRGSIGGSISILGKKGWLRGFRVLVLGLEGK